MYTSLFMLSPAVSLQVVALPRAVVADQRQQFTLRDLEAHFLPRLYAAEGLAQARHRQAWGRQTRGRVARNGRAWRHGRCRSLGTHARRAPVEETAGGAASSFRKRPR